MYSGDNIKTNISSWDFGGDTPIKFDEHISKSVPGYEFGQDNYSPFLLILLQNLYMILVVQQARLFQKLNLDILIKI